VGESAVIGTMTDITDRPLVMADIERERRRSLEDDLRRALENNELFLEYQPIMAIDTGAYIGAEALVRWNHPERGRLEPAEFIELAEESGLIFPLGSWVLMSACKELRHWQDLGLPTDVVMSINLSAVELRAEGLPSAVKMALDSTGVASGSVLLEVTESVLVEGSINERSLRAIRDLGMHVAIDDFGTKYSTLSYLARFPVDALKIDAVFVQGIDCGAGRAIVAAITALGHALGLSVTAEGIETQAQLDAIREIGCNAAQGFLISPPLSADDCLAVLRGAHKDASELCESR
jgi:EAL domain-containing protein (putative c-di-GMP-specific phosphodiesterase class I)